MKNRGITLISLVITIVILIILAGVAINTLVNNGIIDKAKTATQEYKNAQDYEETQIAKYSNDINNYVTGNRDYTSISYSTEEQDTGLKWINGDSIYQKTLVIASFGKVTANSWSTVYTDNFLSSINILVDSKFWTGLYTDTFHNVCVENNTLKVYDSITENARTNMIVTLQYTKK